jgi:methylmalonyl-CoA/ethylmalonyl-CoA epimerase
VPSLGPTTELLSSLFGYRVVSGPFDDPIQKVEVSFLTMSDRDAVEIELIAPTSADSPVQSMLKNKGGAYHLCFETDNIDDALSHMMKNGCIIVSSPAPAVAFQGRRIAWIYTPSRQLFEIVEAKVAE